jgi:lipopolysaccharide transport system permease protein
VITAIRERVSAEGNLPRERRWKLVLEPGTASTGYWRDLWQYRELMLFLTWRDVVVRYKQTAIGIAWAVLRPAATLLVFVAFRHLVGIESAAVPESILVFAAVLPWQFFSVALSESSASLIGNASLISKVYFPRLVVPVAAAMATFADLLITIVLLALLMAWHGLMPGWPLIALPVFVLLAFGVALGPGLLFAALNVQYRDFRYVVPFIVQFGLFISPVAFTFEDVPHELRPMYALNPMVGVIEGFRWSIFGGRVAFHADAVALSAAVTALMLIAGVWYFRRMERQFADVI